MIALTPLHEVFSASISTVSNPYDLLTEFSSRAIGGTECLRHRVYAYQSKAMEKATTPSLSTSHLFLPQSMTSFCTEPYRVPLALSDDV